MAEKETTATTRNYFAYTGLILSIAGVFFYKIGIISLLVVIFSSIGLAKAKDFEGKGKAPAIIGLMLGILPTLMYIMNACGYM